MDKNLLYELNIIASLKFGRGEINHVRQVLSAAVQRYRLNLSSALFIAINNALEAIKMYIHHEEQMSNIYNSTREQLQQITGTKNRVNSVKKNIVIEESTIFQRKATKNKRVRDVSIITFKK